MRPALVGCPICGQRFDPAGSSLCASCPIGSGCVLACCPNCGYSTVDAGGSVVLRTGERVRQAWRRRRARRVAARCGLAGVAAGSCARIDSLDALPADRRDQLLAYGIGPGRVVEVLQTSPVTVVRVEHTELAFEPTLGAAIEVSGA